jgi:hypothetical protein
MSTDIAHRSINDGQMKGKMTEWKNIRRSFRSTMTGEKIEFDEETYLGTVTWIIDDMHTAAG